MGLAASQVRMLSLTSRKASIERDILQGSNRKIALSREMNNLANEYYNALSAERLMYLSDTGEYTNLSYKYLMGQPGGIENLDVKSDKSLILIDTNSGRVVLSEAMANYIGDPEALKGSADNIYKAIARLCGDANIATLDNAPSYLQFSIDPDLVKDICTGKYDNFDETDLTKAIDKYYMTATFINPNNGSVGGTTVQAFQDYRNEWIENVGGPGYPGIYSGGSSASHTNELMATGNVPGTADLKWFDAMSKTNYNTRSILFFTDADHTIVMPHSIGTHLEAEREEVKNTVKEMLTDLVNGLANDYIGHTGFDKKDLQGAIDKTINEFLENTNLNGEYLEFTTGQGSYDESGSDWATKTLNSNISALDEKHLKVYFDPMLEIDPNNPTYNAHIGIDASALVSYFYAAIMGDGVGYNSVENGMDTFNTGLYTYDSHFRNYETKIMLPDSTDENSEVFTSSNAPDANNHPKWGNADGRFFQHFVPAGENLDQWMQNFRDLINDVKFYYPIVTACAKFGYTTDYARNLNDSEYLDKNIQNGIFQLMGFDTDIFSLDSYKDTDYYLLTSEFSKMNDPAQQAIITAWYETEKAEIKTKETYWDTLIENLSTELNSITTEIESVQSLIDDAVKKTFDWGKG